MTAPPSTGSRPARASNTPSLPGAVGQRRAADEVADHRDQRPERRPGAHQLTHPALTTINEHDIGNPGQTVASFRGPISDADFGASTGIAVTGLNNGNGHWEFKIGAGAWTPFGAVSDGAALLLRDTDLVRFVPNNTSGTSASLSYRAWDGISGSAGGSGDATTNGGTTAFSARDRHRDHHGAGGQRRADRGERHQGGAWRHRGGRHAERNGRHERERKRPRQRQRRRQWTAHRLGGAHRRAEGLGTAGALSVGLAGAHGT